MAQAGAVGATFDACALWNFPSRRMCVHVVRGVVRPQRDSVAGGGCMSAMRFSPASRATGIDDGACHERFNHAAVPTQSPLPRQSRCCDRRRLPTRYSIREVAVSSSRPQKPVLRDRPLADWRNGRRKRLKIARSQGHLGSNPRSATTAPHFCIYRIAGVVPPGCLTRIDETLLCLSVSGFARPRGA